jgi:inward rectifier potassium channel
MPTTVKSRWFHEPALQGEAPGRQRHASFLELFADVLVAGAMVALGNALGSHPTGNSFAAFALASCAIWQSWTAFTFYQNRFAVDDLLHRALILTKLSAVGVLGLLGPRVVAGDLTGFSIGYAAVEATLFLIYLRTHGPVPEARDLVKNYGRVYGLNTLVWAAAAFAPKTIAWGLWAIGISIGFWFVLSRRSRELGLRNPPDVAHVREQYGLLTLVLLGEGYLDGLFEIAQAGGHALLPLVLSLIIAFCLFWLYFDDIGGSSIRSEGGARYISVYSHFPLSLGLVTTFAGIRILFHENAEPASRWVLASGLSMSLVAIALIESATERRHAELSERARVNARLAAAVGSLLLAPVGATMAPDRYLALSAVPCIALVVFDLMMAPIDGEFAFDGAVTTAELARRQLSGESAPPPDRSRVGQALMKGAPSELRQDFYIFFMTGPWSRLVVSLIFLYLATNLCFAGLYLLEPGSIGGARPKSFADAFNFSVQTFSTIGYGAMTPATQYGNLVVTAEAAVGLLGAALATGLMFAKATRPRSSAVFSNVAVVTRHEGVPTLIFRVGNARGNDVVDATISVTALRDEISAEGNHLRRQHDLKLVRSRSPFFVMTWVVMHPIDDASPLRDVDWQNPQNLIAIVATLVGHDGTYGQTTYARQVYTPSAIRPGHRFIDVISQLPDGRMMIDYTKFHDTVAVDGVAPPALSED